MSTPRTYESLDGTWALAYDRGKAGLDERWFETPPAETREIQLPAMQSMHLASKGPVGWFFKSFEYDASAQDRFVALHVAAIPAPASLWCNGTRLGDHPGGGLPASFPVGAHLKSGANLVAIRLDVSPGENGEDTGYPDCYPPDTPVHVSLETMARNHIESVQIQPDIRRRRIRVVVEAPADTAVHLKIEETPFYMEGAPGEMLLDFPEFDSWAPTAPVLYTLRVDLIAGDGTTDSRLVSFGMREFTVKDERFYLNNRPFYLKSVEYVPQYPENLKADKLPVLLKRELALLKDAGFNTIRVCGAPAPRALLELADEMGVLVFAEVVRAARFQTASDGELALELQVFRDNNRPALVAWCGMEPPPADATAPDSSAARLRALDPARLILCDAPGNPGESYAISSLMRPYRENAEAFEALRAPMAAPITQLSKDYLRHSGDPGRLNVQNGIVAGGCTGWSDGSAGGDAGRDAFQAAFEHRKLGRCFGGLDDFYEASQAVQTNALRLQLDAVRSNVKTVGYCVTGLCDGPATTPFGLADIKRQAKPALKTLRQVQQDVRPVIQMYKTNLIPREEVGVTILLINESRIEGRGELSLQVVGPTNQVLWKKKRLVKIPRHGRELWAGAIAASGSPGPHRFVVRLMQDRRVIGENVVDMHVVQPLKTEPVDIYVLGQDSRWREACGRLANLHNYLAPIHIVPPLANTVRAYPANDLVQVLAQVYEGAVAIVFRPPPDWNDLAEYLGGGLEITSRSIAGGSRVTHHYAKTHPIFDGLPSRDLMRQPYQNVLPLLAFESETDEEISGVHTAWRRPGAPGTLHHWWGSNITVRRLGAGRVVFTHLRILEHLGADPVADRLFVNLLQHFSRRSIPATEVMAADQKAVEWLRRERQNNVRKWMVVGTFSNWGGRTGHDTVYPPESELDFDATYPGWYRAARWRPWNTRVDDRHTLDFTAALDSDIGTGEPCPYGTAYAYAEFSCDRRQEVAVTFDGSPLLSVWLNGTLVHTTDPAAEEPTRFDSAVTWVKQGKNTMLVKASKGPGPFTVSVDIEAAGTAPLLMNWWK